MHLFHTYGTWEIDSNLSKGHLIIQKSVCTVCGITKFKEQKLPCVFEEYTQFEKGTITRNGIYQHDYERLRGVCKTCGNTHVRMKEF